MKYYILPLGECDCDKGLVLTPGSGTGERIIIPIWASLVQVEGLNILFDTGMHPVHIKDPHATFGGTPYDPLIVPIMKEEDRIENRLAEIGLEPKDIDIVVNTHLHFDHAGNNGLFTNSLIVVQREHYEVAVETLVAFQTKYWHLPNLTYELVDGDAISMEENLTTDNWVGTWNPIKARVSAKRMAAIARVEGGTLLFGHDPESWKALKLSPEYYS
jgi:N-acyl homoserine lactone hydrolase